MGSDPFIAYSSGMAWTGRELVVFGGYAADKPLSSGGAYDPTGDTWRRIAPAPDARVGAQLTYGGGEVHVFGGMRLDAARRYHMDGLSYDPVSDRWRRIPEAPLAERGGPSLLWATSTGELIVWGGGVPRGNVDAETVRFADGAAFNPLTRTWRKLAPAPLAPRWNHAAVWTGERMLVYGGEVGYADAIGDAAEYDPRTDTWRQVEVPAQLAPRRWVTGLQAGPGLAAVFGGDNTQCYEECHGPSLDDGALYDSTRQAWTLIPPYGEQVLSPASRFGRSVVWGAGRLWVVGGRAFGDRKAFSDGAVYDPAVGTWSSLPRGPASLERASATWTGCDLLFFGGAEKDSRQVLLYRP